MSCEAWKWISASVCDEIWPEDNYFVSWQLLRLQNLTLFHLQKKVCRLRSLCISLNKDLNVKSIRTVCCHLKSPNSGALARV